MRNQLLKHSHPLMFLNYSQSMPVQLFYALLFGFNLTSPYTYLDVIIPLLFDSTDRDRIVVWAGLICQYFCLSVNKKFTHVSFNNKLAEPILIFLC